jgi:hypothetical protein
MNDFIELLRKDTGVSKFQLYHKGTINNISSEVYLNFSLPTIQVVTLVWLLIQLKHLVIPYIM